MFLRFEDWSQELFLKWLKDAGFDDVKKIIKVYASCEDPRESFDRRDLAVYQIADEQFAAEELFSYGERGKWTGDQIEEKLHILGLDEEGKRVARSLFRFSNLSALELCQTAMALKKADGSWLIDHPLEDIDFKSVNRFGRNAIHLDVFVPSSIKKLEEFLAQASTLEGNAAARYVSWKEINGRTRELRNLSKER